MAGNSKRVYSEKSKSILLMLIASALWSTGGLFIKNVNAHPLAIAGVRSAIAAVVIFAANRKPKFNWSLPQIGAALSYVGLVFLFVSATKLTTSANAILLQFTSPIYVAILGAWILKERVKLFDWITISIVFGGMVLFFLDKLDPRGVLGNLLAIGSGVCFALLTVFMRMQKDGSPMESILLGNLLTAVIGIPFIAFGVPDAFDWLILLVMGILQLGIPYVLYSRAIKHVTALESVLISGIEPILNPFWVFLLIGEVPGPLALVGGCIVFVIVTVRCIISAFSPSGSRKAIMVTISKDSTDPSRKDVR